MSFGRENMAICDWHPGQLGVVWAGGLVIQGGCIWLWATNRASHTVVEKPVPYLDFVKSYTVASPPEAWLAHWIGVLGAIGVGLALRKLQ